MTFVKKVEDDIAKLKEDDPEVAKIIGDLEASPNFHKIELPDNDGRGNRIKLFEEKVDLGQSQGTIIQYDPNAETDINSNKRTPRVGLTHELRHSFDSDIDVVPTTIKFNGIQLREINAINTANRIRKVTGDKKKTTYGSKKIPEYLLD